MRDKILKVLLDNFKQYNSYKLGKVADEIVAELQKDKKSCFECIHYKTLPVMSPEPCNLCQKGHNKSTINPELCPDYRKNPFRGHQFWKNKSIWEYSLSKQCKGNLESTKKTHHEKNGTINQDSIESKK